MKLFISKLIPVAIGTALAAGCGSSTVSFNPQDFPTALSVSPKNVTKSVGETQQFTAVATFNSGAQVDATQQITWTSSDPAILSIQSNTGLATANAGGTVTVTASAGNLSDTATVTVNSANRLFVANFGDNSIRVFDRNATGDVAPARSIVGNNTNLSNPTYLAHHQGQLLVTNYTGNSVTVYNLNDSLDVAPQRTISGNNTGISGPVGLEILGNELYVACQNSSIRVFPVNASGNVLPTRVISGATTQLTGNLLELVGLGSELFVPVQNDRLLVHNAASVGDQAPLRVLGPGANPGLSDTQAVAIDGQQLLVGNDDGANSSIRRFPLNASGDVAPTSTITGNLTQLDSPASIKLSQGELFVSNVDNNSICVFPQDANGNVAPIRRISGATTALDEPFGILLIEAQ